METDAPLNTTDDRVADAQLELVEAAVGCSSCGKKDDKEKKPPSVAWPGLDAAEWARLPSRPTPATLMDRALDLAGPGRFVQIQSLVDPPAGAGRNGGPPLELPEPPGLGRRGMTQYPDASYQSRVLDAGDSVLKRVGVPGAPGASLEERRELARRIVDAHNRVADALGPVVPRLEIVPQPRTNEPTHWVRQAKVGGLSIDELTPEARQRAAREIDRVTAAAERALGLRPGQIGHSGGLDVYVDWNPRNFRFDAHGNITAWFDPVVVARPALPGAVPLEPSRRPPSVPFEVAPGATSAELERIDRYLEGLGKIAPPAAPPVPSEVAPPVTPEAPPCDGCTPKTESAKKVAAEATKAFAKGALGIAGLYELFRAFPDNPVLGVLGKLLAGTGPVAHAVTKKVEDAGAGAGRVADYSGMLTDFAMRFVPGVGWVLNGYDALRVVGNAFRMALDATVGPKAPMIELLRETLRRGDFSQLSLGALEEVVRLDEALARGDMDAAKRSLERLEKGEVRDVPGELQQAVERGELTRAQAQTKAAQMRADLEAKLRGSALAVVAP